MDPKPTWKVIVNALRSPVVDLAYLAEKVEEAHTPCSASTCNISFTRVYNIILYIICHYYSFVYIATNTTADGPQDITSYPHTTLGKFIILILLPYMAACQAVVYRVCMYDSRP